jgi:hypothetical protein
MDLPGREDPQIRAWEAKLNDLGADGWEVVAVVQPSDDCFVLLKMPHQAGTF